MNTPEIPQDVKSQSDLNAALEIPYASENEKWRNAAIISRHMQPERDAADKMAEYISVRIKHTAHMNQGTCPCSSCEGRRILAAYEAARGK